MNISLRIYVLCKLYLESLMAVQSAVVCGRRMVNVTQHLLCFERTALGVNQSHADGPARCGCVSNLMACKLFVVQPRGTVCTCTATGVLISQTVLFRQYYVPRCGLLLQTESRGLYVGLSVAIVSPAKKRLNRSRCRFRYGLGRAQGSICYGVTLTPPGEYD